MADSSTQRLDTFVDAAFAFAVTLMVAGAGNASVDGNLLRDATAAIPSFAIGFAIVAMFWHAHVRWRRLRGDGDGRSVLLTLLLMFVVLVYVVPLRAMAGSFAAFLAGRADEGFAGSLSTLFTIYGFGFIAMATVTGLLFRDALRNPELGEDGRRAALGEAWIWTILAATGALSTLLAMIPGIHYFAPFLYATLPVTIGVFVWRWNWGD